MPAQGCVDHTINNLILLQYWLKLGKKLREGVNPQQSFNVKLVPQEKTAYTKYNNYLWVVVSITTQSIQEGIEQKKTMMLL